jgi:hypothetical protein
VLYANPLKDAELEVNCAPAKRLMLPPLPWKAIVWAELRFTKAKKPIKVKITLL